MNKKIQLSGNILKIIAAISMLIDHIGLILFPEHIILRIIGRISFPIFAFMISEGCNHTKNKLKYFLSIFILSILCQGAYFVFDKSLYMGVLVTFSLSILVIYALYNIKETLSEPVCSVKKTVVSVMLFWISVLAVYVLNIYLDIDYGFWGCMMPVFASVFRNPKKFTFDTLEKLDCTKVHVIMLGIAMFIVSVDLGGIQAFSLLAIPIIMHYSGKRGKLKMKWFFYLFYPLHLVVLHIINVLL